MENNDEEQQSYKIDFEPYGEYFHGDYFKENVYVESQLKCGFHGLRETQAEGISNMLVGAANIFIGLMRGSNEIKLLKEEMKKIDEYEKQVNALKQRNELLQTTLVVVVAIFVALSALSFI
ncbi:conserved hypothetical protein [Ricinus communis]|uniref:Uncharacterized protein n=1 Tax=Ricinus communis TaxID=3988 RepID=B9T222_RICCO|nr:conserved hypothetical protein [Ricinus communis]